MSSYMYELIKENDRLPVRFEVPSTTPYTFPAHWHKYIEILYILTGKMVAIVQGDAYHLSVGDILIVNSEDIHMTKTYGDKTEYILLQIPAVQLQAYFPDFRLLRFQTMIPGPAHPGIVPPGTVHPESAHPEPGQATAKSPGHILMEMLDIFQEKADGYPLIFSAKLYELLYCLYRGYSRWCVSGTQASENRNFSRIAEMIDWIYEHYREPLSLDEAAAHAGFSREYFCRIFKKCTGQTFLEYVNGVRAMKLYEEMGNSEESITSLMEKHGITNYKVFLQTFRKLYGDTPRGLRKNREAWRAVKQAGYIAEM